jgi:vacuolar-type H+-ATPase subunit H
MAFAATSSSLASKSALASTPVRRSSPFTTTRAAPHSLVVRAAQGPKDAAVKAFGAFAAAQLVLLPLTGAAVADVLPTSWNTADLQKQVLFGFGEKKKVEQKAEKVASKASDAADTAASKVSDAADTKVASKASDAVDSAASKVSDAADTAASKADEATPNSFSIFDADSVNDARQKLKENIEEAVNTKEDPAERVVSVGKPGESQEDNAERIRREAENGPTTGGDARAPTN